MRSWRRPASDGLKPASEGRRVAFDVAGRTVVDGPFLPAREQLAGFWLWEVKDMDEAVAWVTVSYTHLTLPTTPYV